MVGELVVVHPGERIPLGGDVVEGTASVDESSFTGESVPVSKAARSKVIGGTLNLDGTFQVKVTNVRDRGVKTVILTGDARRVRPKVAQKHVSVRYEPAKVQERSLKKVVEKAGFTAVETRAMGRSENDRRIDELVSRWPEVGV